MITVYSLIEGQLEVIKPFTGEELPKDAVWIDMLSPTLEEEIFVERSLSINAPTREEMKKIEALSRSYHEGDASYMTAAIVKYDGKYASADAITFIVTDKCLITLRYSEPRSFSLFAEYAKNHPYVCISSESVFEWLIESTINRLADVIELVGEDMNAISSTIFEFETKTRSKAIHFPAHGLHRILKETGRVGDVAAKVRESLLSLDRALIFFNQTIKGKATEESLGRIKTLRADIHSLSEQAVFISHEINFLLSATLGMINIEQTNIIKIFSVFAVLFMPPTMIASVYGMNFDFMPELHWDLGYGWALLLMFVSGLLPYLYFKKKGWL